MKSKEQQVMERRYSLPYNWMRGDHTRHVRQKNGLWTLALSLSGGIAGKRILDAGCGDGWYSAKMIEAGASVSGFDYSERAVEFARIILPDGTFETASITKTPYHDASFDIVFSFQVLEHLPPQDVDAAVRELVRVTKPGGKIIVSVPSTMRKMSNAHYQHFTPESLRLVFERHSRVVTIRGQDYKTPVRSLVERLIQNRLYTLERIGTWFNRHTYLTRYNSVSAERGQNLIVVAEPSTS